jgi:hypothetical protein
MAKVHIDHLLAQLGIGEMTSKEELRQLVQVLRQVDKENPRFDSPCLHQGQPV